MIIKHRITTDFVNPENMADSNSSARLPQLHMVQGDNFSRAVELEIKVDGQDWDTSVVENVFVHYRKPDGTGGSYDSMPTDAPAWSAEGNIITVMIAPQVLTVPGVVTAQVMAVSQGRGIATFHFQIIVEEDVSLGVVESEDYINWVAWAQNELDARLAEAKESGSFNGADGADGVDGVDGADGATFMPSVSEDGILSWTNDQERENPEDANIIEMLVTELGLTGSTFAPGGYGLGGSSNEGGWVTSLDAMDDVVGNGWYAYHCDGTVIDGFTFDYAALFVRNIASDNGIFQELRPVNGHYVLQRYYNTSTGAWSSWAWVNPPMKSGQVYRTTERWNDKMVYAVRAYFGALPNAGTGYNTIGVTKAAYPNITFIGMQFVVTEGDSRYFNPKSISAGSLSYFLYGNSVQWNMAVTTTANLSGATGVVTVKFVLN